MHRFVWSMVLLAGLASGTTPGAALATTERFEGIPVGLTADGAPYIGSERAVLVMEDWSDFLCPFCGRHAQDVHAQLIERYVRDGQLRIVFRDFPLEGLHPTAVRGHVAARCAAAQSPSQFWSFHRKLFDGQRDWGRLPEPDGYLLSVAESVGLDIDAFSECMRDPAGANRITESVTAGRALGLDGTPSFQFSTLDGARSYRLEGAQSLVAFSDIADRLLAGEPLPEKPTRPRPELPSWAVSTAFEPSPNRPGFNRAGDAYKGNPEAALVVIQFTDFQCPACRRHALEVQPAIDAALVNNGDVLWIQKHLPHKHHRQSPLASAAAECAGELGRYWAMHDALFADIDYWANDDAEQALVRLAFQLGIEESQFRSCLNGRQAMQKVLGDIFDAQGIVATTPAFVLLQDGRGSLLTKPLPADQFVRLLTERLERSTQEAQPAEKLGFIR